MRILLVDDDTHLCRTVKRGLEENAYAVDCVHDGDEGLYYGEHTHYDLIILDVMMPGKDGVEVCRALRAKRVATPVLMLTARDTVADRVRGLDAGGDDYLLKPFDFAELFARVRALLRRHKNAFSSLLQAGDLVLDTATREVRFQDTPVDLTAKEFAVLEYFMHNPNAVLTRAMIESHVWDYNFDAASNLVDVYIRRLRNKIDPEKGNCLIATVRGAGYRLEVK